MPVTAKELEKGLKKKFLPKLTRRNIVFKVFLCVKD